MLLGAFDNSKHMNVDEHEHTGNMSALNHQPANLNIFSNIDELPENQFIVSYQLDESSEHMQTM